MASRKILIFSDGLTFDPEYLISRGEATAITVRALGLEENVDMNIFDDDYELVD